MHKRLVSYVLFLATIVAVLMVVVIQPRNTVFHKITFVQPDTYYAADTCMMGNNITCEQYAAMMAAAAACSGNGGTWDWTNNICQTPPPLCNGTSCTQMTCEMAGYFWDGASCYVTNPNSRSSGGTTPSIIDGVGTSEKLSQRIESTCLDHVAKSGYAKTLADYGWFENIRIYAKNACTLAYLATNGKYSSNNDLYSVANLVVNDDAKRQEDIGLLYKALEDIPAQSNGQSLDDYLNVKKDGAVKRLKDIMDIMSAFNDATTDQKLNPPYLTEPLPYVLQRSATAYNAAHGTKILSLEEKFAALLPKPAEIAKEQPKEPEQKQVEDPAPAIDHPTIIKKADETKEDAPSINQRVAILLTKIVNKLKGIREEGLENGIERKAITPSLGTLQKEFEYQQEIIKAFDTAHDNLCAKLGC